MTVSTEAELGYQDAIRQVLRALHRRLKALEEELEEAREAKTQQALRSRMEEVRHLIDVVESLHR
jgi:hypothetical protein